MRPDANVGMYYVSWYALQGKWGKRRKEGRLAYSKLTHNWSVALHNFGCHNIVTILSYQYCHINIVISILSHQYCHNIHNFGCHNIHFFAFTGFLWEAKPVLHISFIPTNAGFGTTQTTFSCTTSDNEIIHFAQVFTQQCHIKIFDRKAQSCANSL